MTPNDKAMHVFWAVAEALMERFDRSVCDIQVDGVARPTFPQEHVLVNRNAKRTLNAMHRIMVFGCFEPQAWQYARRVVLGWSPKEWERLAGDCPHVVELIEEEMKRDDEGADASFRTRTREVAAPREERSFRLHGRRSSTS